MSAYTIHDRTEGKRGCGYRKGGGLYLVSGGITMPCGRLPIPLVKCPCCSQGIKPSRGWTWVDADKLAESKVCGRASDCILCPLGEPLGKAGLLWVGEKYYPTPGHFTAEAMASGVSRRLSQVPRDFHVGNTWVMLAHRKTCQERCPGCSERQILGLCDECKGTGFVLTPGVFHLFVPTAIEYVVTDGESPAELQSLADRGFTLVRVHRDDGKRTLHKSETEDDDE